jgi:hypothetical protein
MFFGEYPQCGSKTFGTSSTFSFLCKLRIKNPQHMGNFAKVSKP